MALQNHPAMYTGGAAKLDSSSSVNLYANILARRQAKQEALDEYDRNRINTINPTGVRDVDRRGFDERLDGIKKFYIENKDKIRKGNTAESLEHEKNLRDAMAYINASKERTAKQDASIKFYNDKLKQDGIIPDDYIKELHQNDSPLDDPDSRSFDLTKWISAPKPFNQQTYLKSFADIKRTPGTAKYTAVDGQPLKQNEIVEETFDLNSKGVIASRAADKYENSFSFRSQVQNEVKDPVRRSSLAKTFQDQFGIAPSLPEDFATAYTLEMMQPVITKQKVVDNKDAIITRREKFAREMQGRIDARSFGLANLRRSWAVLDQTAQDDFVDGITDAFKSTGKVDPQIVNEYEKRDEKNHPVPINKVVISPDGQTYDFLVTDEKGTTIDYYSTKGVPVRTIKARVRKELETQTTSTKKPEKQQNTKDNKQKKKITW